MWKGDSLILQPLLDFRVVFGPCLGPCYRVQTLRSSGDRKPDPDRAQSAVSILFHVHGGPHVGTEPIKLIGSGDGYHYKEIRDNFDGGQRFCSGELWPHFLWPDCPKELSDGGKALVRE